MSLKNFIVLVLLLSLVIGATLTGGCVRDETATIEDITPQEAFTLIQENQDNPDFVIIDVRTPEEFDEEHLENAVNLDFYAETFWDCLNILDEDKMYLIYCRSGRRSADALAMMEELNFKEAYNILGGINQWKAEGFPTVK